MAALVAPRSVPLSFNRTKTRFTPGSKRMDPRAAAKNPKLRAVPAAYETVTDGAGGARQAPTLFVSQTVTVTGSAIPPVSALTTIVPAAPTFDVPTANTSVSDALPICTTPSPSTVVMSAIVSGIGVAAVTRADQAPHDSN